MNATALRRALLREADIQHAVVGVYTTFGCTIYRFNEGRRTRITPGWPDLYVFCPQKRTSWLHETKRPGGVQSPEQGECQTMAERCCVGYVIGGVHEAQQHLRAVGLIPT